MPPQGFTGARADGNGARQRGFRPDRRDSDKPIEAAAADIIRRDVIIEKGNLIAGADCCRVAGMTIRRIQTADRTVRNAA